MRLPGEGIILLQTRFSSMLGEVIKAWDLGVASMKKGELAQLTCASKYAYGENGSPPKIPPNATLIFEVQDTVFLMYCKIYLKHKNTCVHRYHH